MDIKKNQLPVSRIVIEVKIVRPSGRHMNSRKLSSIKQNNSSMV